jgi:hypothetical protein
MLGGAECPQPQDHRRCELAPENKVYSEGAEAELQVPMKRESHLGSGFVLVLAFSG